VTSVTAVNAIVGTALYMAPEQVAKGNVSPATDIYALGAVAYHCLAGHPPFDGDNALQVALRHLEDEPEPLPAHVPPPVRELIAQAMAKQPTDRFQSAAAFAEAAVAAAGPLDWKRMTGTTLLAPQSPAPHSLNPLSPSPAGATRAVPLPRDLLIPASAPMPTNTMSGSFSRRQPRSQTALLIGVIAMIVLAGGLAVAIALNSGSKPSESSGVPSATPSAGPSGNGQGQQSFAVLPPAETTHPRNQPHGQSARASVSASAHPSGSASASASASTSPTPTPSKTTTSPPTTTPTTPDDTGTTTPPDGANTNNLGN
jgi:serine/threonine-protein kinase